MRNFVRMGLAMMVFVLAFAMPSALAATNVTNCTAISGDVFELQNDISTNSSDCLQVDGDNTILEGNGHTIYYNCSAVFGNDFNNLTIRNLNIVKNHSCDGLSTAGVYYNNVSNVVIEDIFSDFENYTWDGSALRICVDSSDSCDNYTIGNVTAFNGGGGLNEQEALRLGWENSNGNWNISDVFVYSYGRGLSLGSQYNMLLDNIEVYRLGDASGDGVYMQNISDSVMSNLALDGNGTDWTDGTAMSVIGYDNLTIGSFEAYGWNDGFSMVNGNDLLIADGKVYDIAIGEDMGYAISIWQSNNTFLSNIISNRTACDAFSFGGISSLSHNIVAEGLQSYDIIGGVDGTKMCAGFGALGAENVTVSNSIVRNATVVVGITDALGETLHNATFETGEYYDYVQPTYISGNISNVNLNYSYWESYDGCDVNDGDNIGNTPYEVNGSYGISDNYPVTLCFTNYTDFNDSSTDLSSEPDLSNVTDLKLATLDTVVEWSGSGLDVKNKSLNDLISLSSNYAEVNSAELPTLDTTANITFYGVSYSDTDHYRILKDGSPCSDCTKYSANPVKFAVTGFSNYTTESYTPSDGTVMEQQPLLVVVPIVIIGALLLGLIGTFASGLFSIKQMITYAIIVFVALAFIGVMYLI